jgi:hypothetical protein
VLAVEPHALLGPIMISASLLLFSAAVAQPVQSSGRLTDEQAAIAYGQCLATVSARLSHTTIDENKLFESARQSCVPMRVRIQTQAANIVSAGKVLDRLDAEFAAKSVERTRRVRAMKHEPVLQPGSPPSGSQSPRPSVLPNASSIPVATDAADTITRICLAHASGAISLQYKNLEDEIAGIRGLGMVYGVPPEALRGFDLRAQSMINRATLASKPSGPDHVIMAVGGRISNCRVMVSGAPRPNFLGAIEPALLGAPFGWKPLPSRSRSENGIEGRSYVKTASNGLPYLLHMLVMPDSSDGLRALLVVSPVRPGTPVPQN